MRTEPEATHTTQNMCKKSRSMLNDGAGPAGRGDLDAPLPHARGGFHACSGGFAGASAGLTICRQMAAGGIVMAVYGVWIATGRLPDGLSLGTRVVSSLWAVAIVASLGMLTGAVLASFSLLTVRPLSPQRRVRVAAALEAAIVVPLVLWLSLNEFTYSMTSQVIGLATLRMIWSIPAAVFENAWEMGGRYLIAAGVMTIVGALVVYRLAARSMLVCQAKTSQHASSAQATPVKRPLRLAGSMSGVLAVVAGLIVVQLCTRPSEALTAVFRSSPPLRAFNVARLVIGTDLMGPIPTTFGPAIMSEAEYQSAMGKPRQPAPNVILILLESVSASALHCYGYAKPDVSPNMDRLAAEGTLFEHCVSPASFSTYSVVSIMTSLSMLRAADNDHFSNVLFPFLGLPRALKLAGYALAIFSSGNEAFDRINHFTPPSDYDIYFTHDTWGQEKADCMRMDDRHAVGHFEQWLGGRSDPRPFYCSFYLQSTHFNYEVPEPWFSYYQPVPPLYSNGDGIIYIPADVVPLLRNQYDNAMRYSDHWVGRIREVLAKAGALDNSVIVIVGDHGEAFMQHGLARHGVHLWEEMIHVPLIVWVGPAVRQALPYALPSRVSDSVSGLDIAPTVAGLVGIQPHPSWQGVDILSPGYSGRDRPIFSVLQFTQWMECVTLDKWKYIYDLSDVNKFLFDLNSDPGERNNLLTQEPQRAAALHAMLAGWHTYQVSYYARRRFEQYVGRYEPPVDLIAAFRNRTPLPRPGPGVPEAVAARP
ncbi:MAG: sulfatase family protein [Phycisphaerae bacterium]